MRAGRRGRNKKLIEQPELRFRLLLAKTLGRTLDELAATMSAHEYGLWWAWHQREPLDASWWQTGMLASILKTGGLSHAADFVPKDPWVPPEPETETSPEEFVRQHYG